jgi:hypothetical protein
VLYPTFNAVESQVVAGLTSKRKHDMVASLRTIVTTIETTDPVAETA